MKMALGTVQFGMPYGISNVKGQNTERQVQDILEYAHNVGITVIDTAASYGNSEEVLGKVLGEREWDVITKAPSFEEDSIGIKQLNYLNQVFRNSLSALGRQSIYGLLVHSCDDLFKPGGARLFQEIEHLKSSGLVNKIGVSVYSGEQIQRVLSEFDVDLVQLPISIIDQRLLAGGHLQQLKNYGVEIQARSVFLQGLILMHTNSIPRYFSPIKSRLEQFGNRAKELSMNRLELALGFVQSIEAVDRIVVGVNTLNQLREIVKTAGVEVVTTDFEDLSIEDPDFIDPSRWKI